MTTRREAEAVGGVPMKVYKERLANLRAVFDIGAAHGDNDHIVDEVAEVKAVVRLLPGAAATPEELRAWVADRPGPLRGAGHGRADGRGTCQGA